MENLLGAIFLVCAPLEKISIKATTKYARAILYKGQHELLQVAVHHKTKLCNQHQQHVNAYNYQNYLENPTPSYFFHVNTIC